MSASLFLVILGLCCCAHESSQAVLGRPKIVCPSEALLGSIEYVHCELETFPENETLLLQIYKVDDRDKFLGEYTALNEGVGTIILIIKLYHQGELECVAKAQNNSNIKPTVSDRHYLKVVEKVEGAAVDVRSGSVEVFEGKTLKLHCNLTAGNHVSYKWLLNGQLVSQSPAHYFVGAHLYINRTTSEDSGSYMCVATNNFNSTVYTANSSEVVITVKELLSTPEIKFTVLKEDSHNYSAEVTCQSAKGTIPVTFSLYNRTELVANVTVEERKATFKVPLVLDQHLGWLHCQAHNGDRMEFSQEIPLEVVSVGGPVLIHYDYDIEENYAIINVRFYCKAAKGFYPQYRWFLNQTLLAHRGDFYYVVDQRPERSILLLSVGRSSAGTYHCEVSDSFDNTTAISSNRLYLDKEVLNQLLVLVVAVVFGSFTVLVLLVAICCWGGVMFRRRQDGEASLLSFQMKEMDTAYEGELDMSDYNEDGDVGKAPTCGEFDQASEVSVDEWPHIAEEKRTLEDEEP